ncbi:ding family atp-dependent helicase yoaa [hydrocarbon metagenome]|uniref:Ding family atp-dependent helicase yoaa n=1 Tax=hydrocarbon metagenome TaxID=938273 RepID=A0A0W8E5R0_9ZZZZ
MPVYDMEKTADYFRPGGPLERAVPGFVYRQEQLCLAQGIADAFTNREFLVAEAGTGVGKTYAYLLPAFLWSLIEKERVVISTRTKALQQQIIGRDIPDLLEAASLDLKFMEAKGRENYLCWNKYITILAGKQNLNESGQLFISRIINWAEKTLTGDRKELNIGAELMKHWSILAADRRGCRKDMCPYHEKCFRLKMMKNLHKADIIVVNHALLLSDLQVNNSILPEYKYLIIDEAHHFDRESFDKLSCGFSFLETSDLFKALFFKDKKYARGYIPHLKSRYPNLTEPLNGASELVSRSMQLLDGMFSNLTRSRLAKDSNYSMVIETQHLEQPWFADLLDDYQEWQVNTRILLDKLRSIQTELGGQEEEGELSGFINALQELAEYAYLIMEENIDSPGSINWIEYQDGWASTLVSSYIMIGDILKERLYSRLDTLIMVSATLAVEEKFDYFLDKVGLSEYLQEERVRTLLQKSPFDYQKQAVLYTVSNMPPPSSQEHSRSVSRVLLDIIEATGGGMLVLFTARKQLQEVSAAIKPWCQNREINLLIQDESGASGLLLEEFIASKDSVLLGLETFWEGIDVKGEALRCVVIVKLPFRSPSDPFCIASDKHCKFLRRNSFQHFMLPDGAMRFKQGTGRLIRSEADRGVVVVLDNRLEKCNYGRIFKNSIPIVRTVSLQEKDLAEEIRRFIATGADE